MDFGDRPPSAIFATTFFMAASLTESSGRSPTFALIHVSRAYVHVASVEGARGLRLRFRIWSSQIAACSRKVIPGTCRTTSLKYSSVSTPLATMISLALRARLPGVSGEILAHDSAGRTSSENTCSSFSDPILVWRPRTARWWKEALLRRAYAVDFSQAGTFFTSFTFFTGVFSLESAPRAGRETCRKEKMKKGEEKQ